MTSQPQMTHFLIQRTIPRTGLVLGGGCLLSMWLYPESIPCLKKLTLRVVKVFSLYPVFLNLCLKDQ